ncbi:dUTP diphosphatase, partial [Candidatus Woesearchaeota archaeon CG_4_10_14_0_2_um_filter_33_10]
MIKINKIKENAILPHYAHEGDAGVDLYSAENYVLRPGQITLVSTGIKLAIPKGYEAQIRPKSGLAL